MQSTPLPGCYFDSRHGHYITPSVIGFAHAEGFPLDPFAEYVLDDYAEHYHEDRYPTSALDDLNFDAVEWLNEHRKLDGFMWDYRSSDFGLFPVNEGE